MATRCCTDGRRRARLRAPRRSLCPRCPPPAARTRSCRPERFSSAETSSAFKPSPPARQRFSPSPAMRITASSTACCSPAATCARRFSGMAAPSASPSRSKKRAPKPPWVTRSVLRKLRSRRGPASVTLQNLEEQVFEAVVSADREPLDLVLVDVGFEAEEFADAAVEIAERIGGILFVLERQMRAAGLPARAAAEIAAAIERQHGGLFERATDSRRTRRGPGDAPRR